MHAALCPGDRPYDPMLHRGLTHFRRQLHRKPSLVAFIITDCRPKINRCQQETASAILWQRVFEEQRKGQEILQEMINLIPSVGQGDG